ncbi:MAG: 16S rRNA (guanine(527)-N(7))-methyltransferase RsmG [Egibacteraceae bacterium]
MTFHVKRELSDCLARQLELLAELIAASPHNLVSRRDREDVLGRHLLECAGLADALPICAAQRWIDVGTGGGLPGLVLALCRPDTRWTLIDATSKKVEAVRSFTSALDVDNVEVLHGRAEDLAHQDRMRGRFDGAVTRAVGPLALVMELSRGFVAPGGTIAAVRGRQCLNEVERAMPAASLLRIRDIHSTAVPGVARETWVVTMRADGPTPKEFPRRDGIPQSRPLGEVTPGL